MHRIAFGFELPECRIHIDRVPQDNHVDDQSQGPQLVFLPFAVALAQLPPPTMENRASQLVPVLMTVELEEHPAPDRFLINIGISYLEYEYYQITRIMWTSTSQSEDPRSLPLSPYLEEGRIPHNARVY